MIRNNLELNGRNLHRFVGVELTDAEFRELCSKTYLAGIGSDIGIDEHSAGINLRKLQKIAVNPGQLKIIGEFLNK